MNDAQARSIDKPFLLILSKRNLNDDELARMKMTRTQFDAAMQESLNEIAQSLSTLRGDSYRLILLNPGNVHESFTDAPLIQSGGIGPRAGESLATLDVINSATRAFFDKTLTGKKDTLFDRPDPKVKIETLHAVSSRNNR